MGLKKRSIVVVMLCALILAPNFALAETYNVTGRDSVDVTLQTEAKATNVAPSIDDTSFTIKIIAEAEVYPAGHRADASIPFAFTGEDIELTIDVTDDNGEDDIVTGVTIFLSDDESVDGSDISMSTEAVGSTKDGDVRLSLTIEWAVPSTEYGKKNILVTATDSGGLSADNSGLKVGEMFINPQIGFEITNSIGEDVGSIQFPEDAPGTTNVSASGSIRIRNIDPDGVGMYVKASVQGENLVNQNVTGSIPIANMNADGTPMSTELQAIAENLAPAESSTHAFSLNYPLPLPAGNYVGTVTFEIEGL